MVNHSAFEKSNNVISAMGGTGTRIAEGLSRPGGWNSRMVTSAGHGNFDFDLTSCTPKGDVDYTT
jgi:hypothetical protein